MFYEVDAQIGGKLAQLGQRWRAPSAGSQS
jgi:hypothetical protein